MADVGNSLCSHAKLVVRDRSGPVLSGDTFFTMRRRLLQTISCSSRRVRSGAIGLVEGGKTISIRPQHSAVFKRRRSLSRMRKRVDKLRDDAAFDAPASHGQVDQRLFAVTTDRALIIAL